MKADGDRKISEAGMGIRSVAIFCGSQAGRSERYAEAARAFGRALASRELDLVFGGGSVGLMGVLASEVMARGGRAIGVIPRFLQERELGHDGLTELVVVGSMHERKATMAARADAFVALPGGLGTLEELFEAWTWILLGVHGKPCGLLDVDGYFAPLLGFLDRAVVEGFVAQSHRELLAVSRSADELLDRLTAPRALARPTGDPGRL